MSNNRKQVLLAPEKIPSSPRYSLIVRRDYLCAPRLEGDCKVRVNQHLGSETLIKWICTPSSSVPLQDPGWWSPGSAERQPLIGANVEEALRRYHGPPAGGLCAAVQAGWATILTVWYGRRGRCTPACQHLLTNLPSVTEENNEPDPEILTDTRMWEQHFRFGETAKNESRYYTVFHLYCLLSINYFIVFYWKKVLKSLEWSQYSQQNANFTVFKNDKTKFLDTQQVF